MKLSKAIEGFLLYKSGENLAKTTLRAYRWTYERFMIWFGDDPEIESITTVDILKFLDYMKNEYQPKRLSGDEARLSSQSIRHLWTAISSLYSWASPALDIPNRVRGKVPRPKAHSAERVPFTEGELKALFKHVMPKRARRPRSGLEYKLALRDRAILAILLDTGVRNQELCDVKVADIHLVSGRVKVFGKGAKSRYVQLGEKAKSFVWQYLAERDDGDNPKATLISTHTGEQMNRRWLSRHIGQLGQRAGIGECYPHKFRYTFAIQYLRNGGDVFTLQALLGHSSLKMVQHYAKIAGADVERMHRIASPLDNFFK